MLVSIEGLCPSALFVNYDNKKGLTIHNIFFRNIYFLNVHSTVEEGVVRFYLKLPQNILGNG